MPAEVVAGGKLTVLVGAPRGRAALPEAEALLVVEADRTTAENLRKGEDDRTRMTVCAEVLSAQSGEPVRWCLFNDARLNGPLDQRAWQEAYPNLRQIGEEERHGRRLEDILTAWSNQRGTGQQPSLNLAVQQGDPLAALSGLGSWIQLLQAVELNMPAAACQIWVAPVHNWLVTQGFRPVTESEPRWQRDPFATQALQVQERDQQIANLEEQLSAQAVRLLLAQTRHEELTLERDAGLDRIAHLEAEHLNLQSQRDCFITERDALSAQRDQLTLERDAGLERIAHLEAEHLNLQSQRDCFITERDALSAQRDQLTLEREAGLERIAHLEAEQLNLQTQRDAFREQSQSKQQQLDQINTELDTILALIDSANLPDNISEPSQNDSL